MLKPTIFVYSELMKHMVTEREVVPVFLIKQRTVKYNAEKEV